MIGPHFISFSYAGATLVSAAADTKCTIKAVTIK